MCFQPQSGCGQIKMLLHWLCTELPEESIMPSDKKCPLRPFKEPGAWSVGRFCTEFRRGPLLKWGARTPPFTEIGILVKRLAVVDVDDPQVARDLEEQFPIMRTVPCVRTSRGMHYYFLRSAACDDNDFYNQHGQAMRKVDFKTVHSNGTPAFVVCPPSPGKEWVNAPWGPTTALIAIPDELLFKVAVPSTREILAGLSGKTLRFVSHPGQETLLQFGADDPQATWAAKCRTVAPMMKDGETEYPLMSEDAGRLAALFGILCSRAHCSPSYGDDGLALSEWCGEEGLEGLRSIRRLADYLGLPDAVLALLDDGCVACRWKYEEGLRAGTGARLMPSISSSNGGMAGRGVRSAVEAFRALPPFAREFMRSHPRNVILAGGGALGAVVEGYVDSDSDWDFFVYGASREEVAGILWDFAKKDREAVLVSITQNAATVVKDGAVFQLVYRSASIQDPMEIVRSFDMPPSKVCIRLCGPQEVPVVETTPDWGKAVLAGAYPLRYMDVWSSSCVSRVLKYHAKGFDVLLPGITDEQVAKFVKRPPAVKGATAAGGGDGLANLLAICAHVEKARKWGADERPSKGFLMSVAQKMVAPEDRFRFNSYGEEESNYMSHTRGTLFGAAAKLLEIVRRPVSFVRNREWGPSGFVKKNKATSAQEQLKKVAECRSPEDLLELGMLLEHPDRSWRVKTKDPRVDRVLESTRRLSP